MLRKHSHRESRELHELASSIECSKECGVSSFFENTMCAGCLAFWTRAAEIQGISTEELLMQFTKEICNVN